MRPYRPSILDTAAHAAVLRALQNTAHPCAVFDATAGNGHDCIFLAHALNDYGTADDILIACDIQAAAVSATRVRLLAEAPGTRAAVFNRSHEHAASLLPHGMPAAAALFNLGYLPGSDKFCTTRSASTLAALRSLCERLAENGVICIHAYTGHAGGAHEADAVDAFAASLPPKLWRVIRAADVNRDKNTEILTIIEKLPIRHTAAR